MMDNPGHKNAKSVGLLVTTLTEAEKRKAGYNWPFSYNGNVSQNTVT